MLKPWNPDNPAPHFEQYIKLYKMEKRLTEMSLPDFIKNMNNQGIAQGVVCGGSIDDNDHLIEIKKNSQDDIFFFISGVHPEYGIKRNLEELEKCRAEGFLGVNISPYIWGMRADARELFPIYAYCEMHKLVVIIHGSLHYNRYKSMWLGDPKYIDEIAVHFPSLKIVISHAGNGFGVFGLAVAQRHPNVFLEFSALWPEYLPEPTLQAINTYLKNKSLFGTDYPLMDFKAGYKAWNQALRDDVKEHFFYRNALKCLFDDPY